ncbi:MAG TPA: A/G-specific adenine glycosylase [Phycisphaerales bacterium]|nr:A/G-specific adenine glycosylase [Phycisphaerales bacterium]HRQ76488.1 A/G-specific adenine glycosylase [Phycisphaerales bacterium]
MSRVRNRCRPDDRRRAIALAIGRWFAENARTLPWREHRTGYTALVSEAMLQQTQVSRVVKSYIAFMERFPTVQHLANATEQEVLAMWQGLGYYRRARNLHAAAMKICSDPQFSGAVPQSVDQLRELPGVGRYTAGAIASIVFQHREPIVDGNVQRVFARLEGHADVHSREGAALCWEWAKQLVDQANNPGELNEGLMELGAVVCTPRAPRCAACPTSQWCQAFKAGKQESLPAPKPQAKQVDVHHHAVIIRRGGRILLEQRPIEAVLRTSKTTIKEKTMKNGAMWGSMWQTPTIESDVPLTPRAVRARLAIDVDSLVRQGAFVHQTTHRRITFHVFTARTRARRGTWRKPGDVRDLPMSNPQRRIVKMAMEEVSVG